MAQKEMIARLSATLAAHTTAMYNMAYTALIAIILFAFSACFSYSGAQTAQLTGGTLLLSYTAGNINLPSSPYGYETWDFTGNKGGGSENKFTWYGADQGGGGAFRAEWASYFLARLGYYWGNGGKFAQYKNIRITYNYNRSDNSSTSGGFIGAYGWFRNASASDTNKRLIEYYIVDDWFYHEQPGLGHILAGAANGVEHGSFTVDGAVYKIYTALRVNQPSIDGTRTFTQIFSIRQGRRNGGTISVTGHFNEWSKFIELDDIYEAKFKVEAFGGRGYLDLTYLSLSREDKR